MRHHHLDAIQRVVLSQQIVPDQQAHFADHMHGRSKKQVECAGHHPFGGILDAHHAKLGRAGRCGMKNLIKAGAVDEIGRAAKVFDGRLFREGAFGTQNGHPLRGFERQAGRHDLAPDRGHVLIQKGPLIGTLDFLDDLGDAIRAEKGRAFHALDFAHLFGHTGTLIQQAEQLLIDRVDLYAQSGQGLALHRPGRRGGNGHREVSVGAHAWVFSNSRMKSTKVCTPLRDMAL